MILGKPYTIRETIVKEGKRQSSQKWIQDAHTILQVCSTKYYYTTFALTATHEAKDLVIDFYPI